MAPVLLVEPISTLYDAYSVPLRTTVMLRMFFTSGGNDTALFRETHKFDVEFFRLIDWLEGLILYNQRFQSAHCKKFIDFGLALLQCIRLVQYTAMVVVPGGYTL